MRDWLFVAAVALGRVAFGYQFQSVASLGPELIVRFHIDYAGLGALIGLYMLPGVFLAIPGGLLAQRFGARLVVGAGLACMAFGNTYATMVFSHEGIGIGRILSGAGAVTLVVMQGAMVSERFRGARFMPVMGLLMGSFPLGVGLVGLTHEPLERSFGPTGILALGVILALAATALFLATADGVDRGAVSWAFPPRSECVLVLVAGCAWSAYNASYYGFLSYLPSVLAVRGYSAAHAAAILAIATWCNLPSMMLGGWVAARWGVGRVLTVGTMAGVATLAGAALVDLPTLWGALFGTVGSFHAGVLVAIGTLSCRPPFRAAGMGLFYAVYYLGGFGLPGAFGWLADRSGTPAGALAAAAVTGSLTLPLYALHRHLARRRPALA